tara:strand:+ start:9826 stop:10566 length:741 start_codon:yes stop_codon:yes gene_type:complete
MTKIIDKKSAEIGLDAIQDFFFPQRCIACSARAEAAAQLCTTCLALLPRCRNCCRRCGLPLCGIESPASCGQCLRNEPAFDSLFAAYWYEAVPRQLITAIKYSAELHYMPTLMRMFEACSPNIQEDSIFIPVPTHAARVRQRGFNANHEYLRALARRFPIRCDYGLLQRHRDTQKQATLNLRERKSNVRNAFTLRHHCDYQQVNLFDDVVTSTATVQEISRCLKAAGVKQVKVWSLARTKRVSNYS